MTKPGQLSIAVANNALGVTINITQHTSEWSSVLLWTGVAPPGDSIATAMLHDAVGPQIPNIVEFVREYERHSYGQFLATHQYVAALSAFRSFQPRIWPRTERHWLSPMLVMYLTGEPTHGELAQQLLSTQDELERWRQKCDELTLKVHELEQKGKA